METLNISISDLANQMECDRSYISRICSGKRIPKKNGIGAEKLAKNIFEIAAKTNKIDILQELTGCGDNTHSINFILNYLYDDEEDFPLVNKNNHSKKTIFRNFGARLNSIMELTALSNIRLARLLSIDPSYISRFRNGLRSPKSNSKLMYDLSEALLKRVYVQNKQSELATLTDIDLNILNDYEETYPLFHRWLYSIDYSNQAPFLEELLDSIGNFPGTIVTPPLTLEQAADSAVLNDDSKYYFGIDGIRTAVIRFLGNVVMLKPKIIYLYSDQNMDWMVTDPIFRAKWTSLMIMCISNNVEIHIIHNINRDLNEMADAIKAWLPLYPSGMIHSYYSKVSNHPRFSTTIFLCPGYACISGSNVIGCENEIGSYHFNTDKRLLDNMEKSYMNLLENCGELAFVCNTSDIYVKNVIDLSRITVIGNTLSLATISEKTLKGVLKRAGVNKEDTKSALDTHKYKVSTFKDLCLDQQQGIFCNYLPLPTDEMLFNGKVPIDIPELEIAYTPEEYADHIKNTISLLKKYPGFIFYPLPQAVFDDIQIILTADTVIVTRMKAPFISILFKHPDLYMAFKTYVENVAKQYKKDKELVIKELEKYL
ncbi:MAG: helix-turn-helix transcriptional regulator [Lachnospiraceae bacterium]|nr:helix-turn-helix transcriptional regulator [Lachnospiraceae bacterium]